LYFGDARWRKENESKSRRGRKKVLADLLRRSIWLEKTTIDQLEEIARLTNAVTGKDSITFSDVARKLLQIRLPGLLGEMRNLKKQRALAIENALDRCLAFSEHREADNQSAAGESMDQFSWRPDNGN